MARKRVFDALGCCENLAGGLGAAAPANLYTPGRGDLLVREILLTRAPACEALELGL
jgi:hypothetical protein